MSHRSETVLSDRLHQALSNRRAAAIKACAAAGVDALLTSHPTNIEYLTGYSGDACLLLLTGENATLITDARFDEALNPWRSLAWCDVRMGIRHRLFDTLRGIVQSSNLTRIGFEAEQVTVAGHQSMTESLPAVTFIATRRIVASLRERKDALEVEAIERAIAVQHEALDTALRDLVIGMSEREFAAQLEYEMRRRGAQKPSFDTIIGAGSNSSIIHHETGDAKILEGALLVDSGARVNGYCSDLTRTYAIGEMPAKLREIYDIVLEAQLAAIDACAPGRTCAEIDSIARIIITDAGYGENFSHGLGHGLGKDVHEDPFFNQLVTHTRLEPGNVMTVEPGIYLPGVGGVRIEDDVLITESGVRVLTSMPKKPVDCVLEPGAVGSV